METNSETLDRVLTEARLANTDFAWMMGVSRLSVHKWRRGVTVPHKVMRAKMARLLQAVDAAARAGDLPVATRAMLPRRLKIREAVTKHLPAS